VTELKHEHQNLLDGLSEAGYRMTPQRAMIVAAIENSSNHISAEEIYATVVTKYPHVNISTVYRTLELLKQLELVTETNLGNGRVSYHPTGKGQHHHLVCHECGAIIDLDETAFSDLKETLRQTYGFLADLKHMAIFGRCIKCGR
jgi:Fur family ferric uptake transcriptional regulator